jgi:hypothetical protein
MRIGLESIYFTFFKFECLVEALCSYPAYLLFGSPVITERAEKHSKYESFQAYLFEHIKKPKGTLAPRITFMTLLFLVLIPWNFYCGVRRINFSMIYWAGWIVLSILAFAISIATDSRRKKYLTDFVKQVVSSKVNIGRDALLSLLIVVGIAGIFVFSFVFYLNSLFS